MRPKFRQFGRRLVTGLHACEKCGLGILGPGPVLTVHLTRYLVVSAMAFGISGPLSAEEAVEATPIKAAEELTPEQVASLEEGKSMFRGLCSGCHGGAGRGGKGPNLTDDRWLHGDKDEDIIRVIENGVPGTTMKKLGESLTEEQIAKILGYIRSLASLGDDGDWQPYMEGDPKLGEALFFDSDGKAQCFKCHTVARRGGRIGPQFDRIVARRSPRYIMESIVLPSRDIDPRYEVVIAVTNDGKAISGVRVNETNFSLQLREEDGRFHSLLKRDLEEIHVSDKSMMPENLNEQLTVKQLHDIFAFLMTLE